MDRGFFELLPGETLVAPTVVSARRRNMVWTFKALRLRPVERRNFFMEFGKSTAALGASATAAPAITTVPQRAPSLQQQQQQQQQPTAYDGPEPVQQYEPLQRPRTSHEQQLEQRRGFHDAPDEYKQTASAPVNGTMSPWGDNNRMGTAPPMMAQNQPAMSYQYPAHPQQFAQQMHMQMYATNGNHPGVGYENGQGMPPGTAMMSPAPSTQSHQVQLNIQSANNIGPEAQQALNYFTQADSNSDGWLDFLELHQLLRNHNQTQYEAATVWYLLTTFADKATPDRVNFDQFYTLWQYLAEWHVTFKRLDADGSGMINEVELGRALRSFQQPASPQFVKFLMDRFAPEGASELNFDVFLRVCSSVRTLGEQFKKLDRLPDGRIIATPEQLIQCALLEIVS